MNKQKTSKTLFLEPVLILIACAVVGALAARGTFLSMTGFPWIFGVVCLAVGSISLLRTPRRAILARFGILLVAASLAFAGWVGQNRLAERNRFEAQQASLGALKDQAAPSLAGLEPLNVEPATLDEATSYSAKATIVTFWARWCSPCWTELPELNEFYEQHKEDGFAVIAVTKYDRHEGESARHDELEKAREFVADYGLTFPCAIAPDDEIHTSFAVTKLPSIALIDGEGNVVGYGVGLDGSRAVMAQALALLSN